MRKPKKAKLTRSIKPRKSRIKKVKNSFLQIGGKEYIFELEVANSRTLSINAILVDTNEKEFLVKAIVDDRVEMIILKRERIYVVREVVALNSTQ